MNRVESKELIKKVAGTGETKTIPGTDNTPKLGEWYWVTEKCRWDGEVGDLKESEEYTWFGCVMAVGSNYVELHTPHSREHGYNSVRIHMDEFWSRLKKEENSAAIIQSKIGHYQGKVSNLMAEVKRVTARLGLNPKQFLSDTAGETPGDDNNTALIALSGTSDVKAYESSLVEAKEKTLPDLFEKIKKANIELCRWLSATAMETQVLIEPMKQTIGKIEGRIFNVSLYAGLTENVVQITDGPPAGLQDKLHVMQRRLCMDEECLLNYEAGGMEFKHIEEFDAWIAKPENRDRILPFQRTLVAFRVRRGTKVREWDGSMLGLFIMFQLEHADKTTFFYIRNGEQLYRMNCELDFPEMIFPDKSLYDPGQPMMVKMFCNRVEHMMTLAEWEHLKAKEEERKRKSNDWKRDNPNESWINNPYRHSVGFHHKLDDFKPFDLSNVYFDEAMAKIEAEVKQYNRIAIIIQGLFDRSLVLAPHPPVRTWEPEGFSQAIQLVFDGATTLYHGEPPNFEAYRAQCNASLNAKSIVTGQELFWEEQEAKKHNNEMRNSWKTREHYRDVKRYRPYGNPGPGRVAKLAGWKARRHEAVFRWLRETHWKCEHRYTICTITVPAANLLNISAYRPGDYKQFFQDPRTRERYLQWAPLLLTAEDYYVGKIKAKEGNYERLGRE
ncbi:MAG: hypothetical protein CSYNP_02803 [Syntrophus sp. SKADARSKE-3]|nr:hypothetical protein [Syntrophus sp. SKADARSKE-3]